MRNFPGIKKSTLAALVATLVVAPHVYAQTPWLPSPGSTELTLAYTNQKADQLKAGTTTANLPVSLKQDTIGLTYGYGLSDALAFDANVGHAKSKFIQVPGLAPDGGRSGVTDSRLGLRFRVLDDLAEDPVTLTLGAAAILKGNYKTGALPAIGDGANAIEVSVSVGKAISANVNVYGVLGYRNRETPVPKETFVKAGINANFTPQIYAALEYQKVDARGGLDIGGPGFSPARFPEVQEDFALTSVTLGYRFSRTVGIAIQYGDKQGQRNTALSKVTGISLTTAF